MLTATKPAPLSVDEITNALEQLARHPDYRGQLVVSIAEDGRVVTMREGTATVASVFEPLSRLAVAPDDDQRNHRNEQDPQGSSGRDPG